MRGGISAITWSDTCDGSSARLQFFFSLSLPPGRNTRRTFPGVYVRSWPKPEVHHGKALPPRLKISQHGRVLTATRTDKGKTRTSTYYLDGAESENLAAGGAPSRDKAQIKDDTLQINSVIQVRRVTLELEQKWKIAGVSRHLIIETTAGGSSNATGAFTLGSFESVYKRVPVPASSHRPAAKSPNHRKT